MSDIIRLLPDSVANQIAAGEVIQRPASVIKELVENAVDAGATEIEIIITDAGRTLIQVIDNGCGMSPTDARMAFERHATSKIKNAEDLFSLHTMGFRGEALASIAAVARIELKTKSSGSNIGTCLIINGSKVESQEAESCPSGSNFKVKSLFFNVPARRKFLKKDSIELAYILREFERLALVNTDIIFSISHNNNLLHRLNAGSLKQRIIDLFGKGLERQLIPVETSTNLIKIKGFVALPQFAKKRNHLQYLFVNGRNMKHPYFHKAVIQCYSELIPNDEQPDYFLDFIVAPESIDVNIHPTKNEIKFENESSIWQILVAAIKESLGSFNGMPGIDFSDDIPQIPFFNPKPSISLDDNDNKKNGYNPFIKKQVENPLKGNGADWNRLYEEFSSGTDKGNTLNITGSKLNLIDSESEYSQKIDSKDTLFDLEDEKKTYLFINGKYIVLSIKQGVIFIDFYRAHIRVLYDKFIQAIKNREFHCQKVMFPEVLSLSPSRNIIMENLIPEFQKIGFEITSLGGMDWNITGYPSILNDVNPLEILQSVIENEADNRNVRPENDLLERIALSMAKETAIRKTSRLSETEIDYIISRLFSSAESNYTPDGLKIICQIDSEAINKMFE